MQHTHPRERSLPVLMKMRAEEHPDAPWLTYVGDRDFTYGEGYAEMLRWADAFSALGIERGENVVTMMNNSLDSTFTWLGLATIGAIDTGCNVDFRGGMLEYIINNSTARVMVAERCYLERIASVASLLNNLETVVVIANAKHADVELIDLEGIRVVEVDGLVDQASAVERAWLPEPWDLCCITYTSGTTGPSKGVLVPWAQLCTQVEGFAGDVITSDDVIYNFYPPAHLTNRFMLFLSVLRDGRCVSRERFSGTEFWDDVRREGITTVALLGTMAPFLYAQPETNQDSDNTMTNVVMFPLVPELDDFKRRFGIERVRTMFSSTEMNIPILTDWNASDPAICGQVREGYPYTEVRLVDENDYDVPVGEVGELIVRTAAPWTMNQGYFGMPEASMHAWRNGWFHTGDGLRRDEDGNYYFVDRIKDALRRRGENISSFEVERLVLSHPNVSECAVIGVPSELGEDEIKAVVVMSEGADLKPADLVEYFVKEMPKFMVPRFVEMVTALPKTQATERVRKVELRETAFNAATWDREKGGYCA